MYHLYLLQEKKFFILNRIFFLYDQNCNSSCVKKMYISIKTTLKYRFETCLIGLFGPHFVLFSKKNEGNFH